MRETQRTSLLKTNVTGYGWLRFSIRMTNSRYDSLKRQLYAHSLDAHSLTQTEALHVLTLMSVLY